MTPNKSLKNDLEVLAKSLPHVYFIKNNQQLKVNHKKRVLTSYKKDGYTGVQNYVDRVTKAYEVAMEKKRVILFYE